MFCYQTSRISVNTSQPDFTFDPLKCDAVKSYMTHYQNLLTLTFFADNGTIPEKVQAKQELEICRRKMAYWRRQPHFCQDAANRQIQSLKRQGA
ncbi:hypothetical protein [Paracoccus litorisediminis]|uniref:Uncharacterized protein n=1 Tax=Paracoccus litorisediminis TaxID=2006130 RepID=A0A844HS29_9RHOB|nr:hypothetical protein [Paracoccus litorisediminis]MTH61137.1 hypothetical protein [Paracoccus litorisediminis]